MLGLDDLIAGWGADGGLALALLVAVLLGLRHATDPDHLTAVSSVVLSERRGGRRGAGALGPRLGRRPRDHAARARPAVRAVGRRAARARAPDRRARDRRAHRRPRRPPAPPLAARLLPRPPAPARRRRARPPARPRARARTAAHPAARTSTRTPRRSAARRSPPTGSASSTGSAAPPARASCSSARSRAAPRPRSRSSCSRSRPPRRWARATLVFGHVLARERVARAPGVRDPRARRVRACCSAPGTRSAASRPCPYVF